MAEHTPGPWYALPGQHNISIRYKTGDKNFPVVNVASVRGKYSDGFPYGTSEGNARLILAAPDLLKALQEIADSSPESTVLGLRMAAAAAIAPFLKTDS